MARRKLSQQQAQRIQELQAQRKRRARDVPAAPRAGSSELGAEQHGLIIAHHGAALTVEANDGALVRCSARRNLGALACGDRVVWQSSGAGEGVVVAVHTRRSVLIRPAASGQPRPLAANLDRIFIVAAAHPEPSEHLIDRYLVAAELTGIAPVIVLNKRDLLFGDRLHTLQQRMAVYERIGYPLLYVSAVDNQGLGALRDNLKGHTSVLVGQSGVGKSSLVKALLPDRDVRIAALGDSRLGRHTTTTALLYHLPDGGDLIDSPGVRDFALWQFEPAHLVRGFKEFAPYLGRCKFNDCSHRNEPECALQHAADSGHIDRRRLQSYLQIMTDVASSRAT